MEKTDKCAIINNWVSGLAVTSKSDYWSREDREASTNSGMTAIEPAKWFFAMGTYPFAG